MEREPCVRTSSWSASAVRSSSPRRRTRRPTSAPASWTASSRRSFVSTVQWHWSSSSRAGGPPRTAFESSRTRGESSPPTMIPRPPQPGHAARPSSRLPPAKSSRPVGRQLRGPFLCHDGVLTKLAADSSDDRDRQLGLPADAPRRDGLQAGERRQHRTDTPFALGEPDRGGHVTDDAAFLSQGPSGCSGRAPARRRGARGSSLRTRSPSMSPHVRRSTLASRSSGQVWMVRCDCASRSTPVTAPFGNA